MDIRSLIRFVIAGLVGLLLIVLVIVLIAKSISGPGSGPGKQTDVTKYADQAATVTLLVDAPINVDQDHRQVKITVSNTQNEIDVLQGYQGNTTDSRTYPNNSAGFMEFLQALKLMNFSKGDSSQADKEYRGYCPTGDRYVFTFNDGTKDLFTYWATSCGSQGTYGGQKLNTLELIRHQIPETDFDQLTGNITLGF